MKLVLTTILSLFIFSSCTSFNSGLIKDVNSFDLAQIKSEKIILKIGQVADIEVEGKRYTYMIDERLQSYGLLEFRNPETNVVCKTNPCNDRSTDVELYIDYSIQIDYSIKKGFEALLFMFTLGLFPASDEYEIKMNAVAINRDKKIIGQYQLEDKVKTHYQIFLLFIAPFLKTTSVSEAIANMSSTLVLRADADFHKKISNGSASPK